MSASFSPAALFSLSAAFRAVRVDSAPRQMGRRWVKDAIALGDRNLARSEELFFMARAQLPYAKAYADARKGAV